MCGIVGLVDFNCKSDISVLKKMTNVLFHRGPDKCGYFFGQSQVGLGHRRLSILDLSDHGNQPISFGDLIMVYNGEVYNYIEVRNELEKLGYEFESSSDTEVVLKAYHKWGIDAVHRFNGMFAFAIFDSQKQNLILVRDRAGVKPLYWYQNDGLFLFSSELKSFHEHPAFIKEINHDGLTLFLKYGYIPQPYSIFNHVHKLNAGHTLTLNLNDRTLTTEKYWDVIDFYKQPKLNISEQEALEVVESLLKSACEYRMVADVPVGIFLSGGYDSSAVTSLLQTERTKKIKTFSIGFHDEKFNEAHHAKNVAEYLNTDHTEYYISHTDTLKILPKLPEIWDEPFGDPSSIPTVLVSMLARSEVSVALSADGGDEIFGGYDKYTGIRRKLDVFNKLPFFLNKPSKALLRGRFTQTIAEKAGFFNAKDRLNRFSEMIGENEKEMLKLGSQAFTDIELSGILLNKVGKVQTEFDAEINLSWLDNVLAIDYKTYQSDDILTKVDRATMSVSLEGREPLLDYRVIEFVAKLDPNMKIKNGTKKYLLKKIVHKYLPEEIMDRPKMGFGAPIFDWFKAEFKDYLMTYLSEERLEQGCIFNVKSVISLRDRYLAGLDVNINQIWYLLMFEMWREKWM